MHSELGFSVGDGTKYAVEITIEIMGIHKEV
jgi:hypothetical protein